VTSCSSSNSSLVLLSLWYRLLAASSVVVVPVFDSLYLPRFCCCGAVMLVFFSCSLTLAFALASFLLSFFWCDAFFAVPYFGFERYSAAFGVKGYWGSVPPTLLGPHILSFAACGVLGFGVVSGTEHRSMLWCGEHHSSFEGSTPQSGAESLVGAPLDSDLSSTLFLSRTLFMRRSYY
jgi:hypothetical protein